MFSFSSPTRFSQQVPRLHRFHVSAARAGGGETSEEDVPTAAAVPAVHVHVCVTGDRSCVCTDAYYSVKHLTSI